MTADQYQSIERALEWDIRRVIDGYHSLSGLGEQARRNMAYVAASAAMSALTERELKSL